MTSTNYRARRAVLDDLGSLVELWKSMAFGAEELARHITEFQVVEALDGSIKGAVGLRMAQRQGLIHSEAFTDFALADQLRPLLWERIQTLANNNGLLRLWTLETAPFWSQSGLGKPDAEAHEKRPTEWKDQKGSWLTLKLREDPQEIASVDAEFALFMESERRRTQRAMHQAKILKYIATLIALGLVGLMAIGAFMVFRKNPGLMQH